MMSVLVLKLVAILIVTAGSLFFGLLPAILGLGTKFHGSLLSSFLLCFGGGVLLSTSIVHILPECREELGEWTEIIFCSGFMFIYLSDVLFSLVQDCKRRSDSLHVPSDASSSYSEISPLNQSEDIAGVPELKCANFGLIVAFSIHSLLEGLVIGIEPSVRGVWVLLLAVCCHKLLVAFCLGAELSSDGRPTSRIIPPLSVFSIMSGAGIALGSVMPDHSSNFDELVPTLQALTGGTLLYVVMCEILPREKAKANELPACANLAQYIAVLIGFGFMAAVTTTTED